MIPSHEHDDAKSYVLMGRGHLTVAPYISIKRSSIEFMGSFPRDRYMYIHRSRNSTARLVKGEGWHLEEGHLQDKVGHTYQPLSLKRLLVEVHMITLEYVVPSSVRGSVFQSFSFFRPM